MSVMNYLHAQIPWLIDAIHRITRPPIQPEDTEPEWDDSLGDYDKGTQEIDLRMVNLDGRPIELVIPHFDVFHGENTDLYAAFSRS